MKSKTIQIITRAVIALFFAISIGATAQAGPGAHVSYAPVKTMKEAEAIKTGDRIAISCGNCGVTSTFIAGADRSFLKGYTCATCKKKFVTRTDAHGGATGTFVYEDGAGHQSHLLCAK